MKKGKILLSIIVPIYNLEKYIAKCLNSMIEQISDCVEIILINDGSTDNSEKICKEYSKKYSYIKYFYQENAGVSVARNQGILKAKGKYIIFVDGDDWLLKNSIDLILNKVKSSDFDMILGDFIKVHNHDKMNMMDKKNSEVIFRIENAIYPYNVMDILEHDFYRVNLWCNVFKRDFLKKNNIEFLNDVKYTEDLDFCLKAFFNSKKIGVLKYKIYAYRQTRALSATSKISKKRVLDNLDLINRWYLYYQDMNAEQFLKDYLISFLAYEYAIVYSFLFLLNKEDFDEIYQNVFEKRFLLKNSKHKKVKIIAFLSKIIGFNNTGRLLAKFMKLKK